MRNLVPQRRATLSPCVRNWPKAFVSPPSGDVSEDGDGRSGIPGARVSVPAGGLRGEVEKPRCSSTPCSPVKSPVSAYQIVHMDCNYLVGFTTGRSFWSGRTSGRAPKGPPPLPPARLRRRGSRRTSSPNRWRRGFTGPPGSTNQEPPLPALRHPRGERAQAQAHAQLGRTLPQARPSGEPSRAFHGPLPLCLPAREEAPPEVPDYSTWTRCPPWSRRTPRCCSTSSSTSRCGETECTPGTRPEPGGAASSPPALTPNAVLQSVR